MCIRATKLPANFRKGNSNDAKAFVFLFLFFCFSRTATAILPAFYVNTAILTKKKPKERKKYVDGIVKNWFLGHFNIAKAIVLIKEALNGPASHIAGKTASVENKHLLASCILTTTSKVGCGLLASEEMRSGGVNKPMLQDVFYVLLNLQKVLCLSRGFLFTCG